MAWAWQIQYCDPLLLFSWEQIYCQNLYIQRMRRQKRVIIKEPLTIVVSAFYKYFNRTKLHSLFAYLWKLIHIWVSQERFQISRTWFLKYFQIVVLLVIRLCNKTNVYNAHTFSDFTERQRQRLKEWERERESGGEG